MLLEKEDIYWLLPKFIYT